LELAELVVRHQLLHQVGQILYLGLLLQLEVAVVELLLVLLLLMEHLVVQAEAEDIMGLVVLALLVKVMLDLQAIQLLLVVVEAVLELHQLEEMVVMEYQVLLQEVQ
jgi:hypothetical protein